MLKSVHTAPIIDTRRTLIAMAEGSVGTKAYRHLYLKQSRSSIDVLRDGELSCAFFTSDLLHGLGLIAERHATVAGTLADMQRSGWIRIRSIRPGAILEWAPITYPSGESHSHIGIAISRSAVISTSFKKRAPIRHHPTYGRRGSRTYRPVVGIWWHRHLE